MCSWKWIQKCDMSKNTILLLCCQIHDYSSYSKRCMAQLGRSCYLQLWLAGINQSTNELSHCNKMGFPASLETSHWVNKVISLLVMDKLQSFLNSLTKKLLWIVLVVQSTRWWTMSHAASPLKKVTHVYSRL